MNQVTLTTQDQQTLEASATLDSGHSTAAEATALLGVGLRQVRRKLAASRREGAASIPHKNRARKPAHALSEDTRATVAQLSRYKCFDCNDHHFQELLAQREGIALSVSSVRRIRHEASLASPRKRRAPRHRARKWVALEAEHVQRARVLQTLGLGEYDALHVACAEAGAAEVLLTRDDRLLRTAARHAAELHVRAANPVDWLREMVWR